MSQGFPYNTPKFVGGIVVTKYREGTPPEEMRRIRAESQKLADQHSDVWYWDWKARKRIKVDVKRTYRKY